MTRVAFLACHLSGSGHLARTLALARGVAAAGAQALVISGGRALPHLGAGGVALAQLPPVAVAGFDYARLLTAAGAPADAAFMAASRRARSASESCGRSTLMVSFSSFAVSAKGGV